MRTRHPSRQRLQRWLETGESRRVDRHVDECAVCQETLDALSALDEDLVADLQAATTPPADIAERTHGGVDSRLRDEAAFAAFLDLFAVGWEVARCVLDPTTDGDEAHGSGTDAEETSGGNR
jgi:hypothetical protein